MSTILAAGGTPAMINPFEALSRGVHKAESVAFTIVYGIFLVLLGYRLFRRPNFAFIYRFLTLFTALRVGTFIVRYIVAAASPTASNYKTLLIVSGVFLVAGFLFLAEAVMAMLFEWSCVMREVDNPKVRKIMAPARHGLVAGISIIGIVGAVLQIVAVDNFNMSQFNTAKALRQASGALFMAVSLWVMVVPLLLLAKFNPLGVRKLAPTAVLCVSGTALMIESVYRVVSASSSSGWILSQQAVDVLLFMPEALVLILFVGLDFDDLADVRLFGRRGDESSTTPSPSKGDEEIALEPIASK